MSDHEALAENHKRIWLQPLCCTEERCWCEDPQPCDDCGLPAIEYVRADLVQSLSLSDGWRPVEAAPENEDVLLGWWSTWPSREWKTTVDLAICTKGGWKHGQATHWMPLPAAPLVAEPGEPKRIAGDPFAGDAVVAEKQTGEKS